MIEVRDIHKSFGSIHVLKGVSMTVGRGEVVVVIGPSGSGKSTLLRCVNRLEEVEGRLYLTGTGKHVRDQITRTGKLRAADSVHVYEATAIVGESTRRAVADARAWLATVSDAEDSGGESEASSQGSGRRDPEPQG